MKFSLPLLFLTTLAATTAGSASDPMDGCTCGCSNGRDCTCPRVELDAFAITAPCLPSLTVSNLEATRVALTLVPGGTETIDAERYLRGRASTVADTFALSAGVVAQSRFGSDEARLAIRGSGLQRTFHGRGLRVLQDGVPLNLADGGFDMQAIEPLSAAYIAIWRGGNALAAGASTLGGAIDYVSRTGRDAPPMARVEVGSWGYLRASIAGGGVRGDLDGYLSLNHQQQDGFRRHATQENRRLFANAGLRLSDTIETRLFLTGVTTDSELPGSLTKAQLATNPRAANAGNLALDQKRDFKLLRLANKTTARTGETVWDFTAAWTHKDLDHPIFQVIDQLSNDALLGVAATHAGDFAGRAHRVRAGLLYNRGVTRAANFVNAAGRRTALVSAATQTATNLEAFAEDQVALARHFTLVLGASASTNRRKNNQTLGVTPDYDLNYDRVMPKLGLRWDSADQQNELQVYANVSGSYEPPSFSETLTLNTARFAQTATTWELGTRGLRGAVRWDASVYHAKLRNELLALDHDNNPATAAATVNANRTLHAGVEFAAEIDVLGTAWSARATPAHRLVLRVAWTYGDFQFDGDVRYGNNTLAGLPPHLIRGELSWETATGWYAGPSFEWVPQRTFIDFRNTYAADAYAIAGCRVGRRTAQGISWFAEVRNAFDKKYAATTGVIENAAGADQAQFLPGDGRGLFGGIEYRW
jgi:iron complex outermembrane receptor protein